ASCPGHIALGAPNAGFAPFLTAQDILPHENLARESESELKLRRQSAISPVKAGAKRLSASEPDHDGRNPSRLDRLGPQHAPRRVHDADRTAFDSVSLERTNTRE